MTNSDELYLPSSSANRRMQTESDVRNCGGILFNEFVVERRLGTGGFGTVALVRSQLSGERFAVKRTLIAEMLGRARLMAELHSWMSLPAHPNLVACRFFRSIGDEIAIFAEYVPGGSLQDWLQTGRLYAGGEDEVLKRVLDTAIQSAWGLHVAHSLGIVHLDVKPGNILLTEECMAKITDFGSAAGWHQPSPEARAMDMVLDHLFQDLLPDSPQSESVWDLAKARLRQRLVATKSSDEIAIHGGGGTQGYRSPEQAEGRELNRRTDVWSWGVTVLEMFQGGRTWPSGTIADSVLEELLQAPADPPVPRLPSRVAALLRECFRANPTERWASLEEAAQVLAEAFQEACGYSYPRRQPVLPDLMSLTPVRDLRRHQAGSEWRDPKIFLHIAYLTAGKDPARAAEHWPVRLGTRRAQVLGELRALEEARRLLTDAMEAGHPEAQYYLGTLCGDIGLVKSTLGDVPGATREYERCVSYLEPLHDQNARYDLAVSLNRYAILLRNSGCQAQALAACDRCVSLCEEPGDDSTEFSRMRATVLLTKGNTIDDRRSALALYNESLDLIDVKEDPEGSVRVLLSKINALRSLGESEEANALQARVDAFLGDSIAEGRHHLRHILGRSKLNQATTSRHVRERLMLAHEAIQIYSPLVTDEGHVEFAGELGKALFYAGYCHKSLSEPQAALDSYRRSREFFSLAVINEGRSDLSTDLAQSLTTECTLVRELVSHQQAVELARKAVELWENLTRLEGRDTWGLFLASAKATLGSNLNDAGEFTAALAELDQAVGLFEELTGQHTGLDTCNYAIAVKEKGIAFRRLGDPDQAVCCYREALKVVQPLNRPEAHHVTALILLDMSNAVEDTGNYAGAMQPANEAIDILTSLVGSGEVNGCYDLASAYLNQTKKAIKLGSLEQACTAATHSLRMYKKIVCEERLDLVQDLIDLYCATATVLRKRFKFKSTLVLLKRARQAFELFEQTRLPTRYRYDGVLKQVAHGLPIDADATSLDLNGAIEHEIEFLQELLKVGSEDTTRFVKMAKEFIGVASKLYDSGNMYMACDFCDKAIEIYVWARRAGAGPQNQRDCADAYSLKAVSAAIAGRIGAAEEAFPRAMAIYETLLEEQYSSELLRAWATTCGNFVNFLLSHGDEGAAEVLAERMSQRDTEMAWALVRHAGTGDAGERAAAVSRLRQMVADFPGNPVYRLACAFALSLNGGCPEGLEHATLLSRHSSASHSFHFNLGQVFCICGDPMMARRHFDLALRYAENEEDRQDARDRIADLEKRS